MKCYSSIVLCNPALGRQMHVLPEVNVSNAHNVSNVSTSVPELTAYIQQLNVSEAMLNLPFVNLTEGMYNISTIDETGLLAYVGINYKWEKIGKWRAFPTYLFGAGIIGTASLLAFMVAVSKNFAFAAMMGIPDLLLGYWAFFSINAMFIGGIATVGTTFIAAIFAKDSLKLTEDPTPQEWKLTYKPTSLSGTFELENIRNAKGGRAIDASLLGLRSLRHPFSSWALRARLVDEPLIHLKYPGDQIVVLEFINLNNNETRWLSAKKTGIVSSEREVTAFIFSPKKSTL